MKNEQDPLTEAIYLLKKKQTIELALLKEQVHVVHESFKPINILKNTISQVTRPSDTKENIIDGVIGLAMGYFSKKIFVGASHNPIKQIAGTLLQLGITTLSSKHADVIRSIGDKVVHSVFKKQHEID